MMNSIWQALLAATLGFGGGQLALWVDRKRVARAADAEWTVDPTGVTDYPTASVAPRAQTYIVKNHGETATEVKLAVRDGTVVRLADRSTFEKHDDEIINVPVQGDAVLEITWVSHRGMHMTKRLVLRPKR